MYLPLKSNLVFQVTDCSPVWYQNITIIMEQTFSAVRSKTYCDPKNIWTFKNVLQFFSVANKRLSNQLSHFQNSKHN